MGDRVTTRRTPPVRELGDDPGPPGHEGSPILENGLDPVSRWLGRSVVWPHA